MHKLLLILLILLVMHMFRNHHRHDKDEGYSSATYSMNNLDNSYLWRPYGRNNVIEYENRAIMNNYKFMPYPHSF
jgi:hypothetical protein